VRQGASDFNRTAFSRDHRAGRFSRLRENQAGGPGNDIKSTNPSKAALRSVLKQMAQESTGPKKGRRFFAYRV
jgi:hypothetical protein